MNGRAAVIGGVALLVGLGLGLGVGALRTDRGETPAAVTGASTDSAQAVISALRAQLAETDLALATTRCALGSAGGINAYHDADYALAIELYDQALTCDPSDGYVLGLKAYSLFKSERVDAAIEAQRASLEALPDHALGYFNLSRFLCARGDFEAAEEELATAVSLWPDIEAIAADDGEYRSLCRDPGAP